MAVDDAGPVRDYVCEVGAELLKVNEPSLSHVHQSETELVAFVRGAVAHNVHDPSKLLQGDKAVLIGVEALENTVCQKGILVLAQQSHNSSELLSLHHPYFFLNLRTYSGIKHFYVFKLGMAVKTVLEILNLRL